VFNVYQQHIHQPVVNFISAYSVLTFSFQCFGSRVGFNVPPNTLYVISGTIFMGQMTQPTVSKHWRTIVEQATRYSANPIRPSPLQGKVK